MVNNLWLVVWNHGFYVSIYWECHHPNLRSHIFQRGRYTTNQNHDAWGYILRMLMLKVGIDIG